MALATNLVAHYKLDSSLTTDSVGSFTLTNNGTVASGAGFLGTGSADFGTANTTKYLSVANNMGVTTGSISMSCWVNINTALGGGAYYCFLNQGDSGSFVLNQVAYFESAGVTYLRLIRTKQGVANDVSDYAVTLAVGKWNHVAYTYDGTTAKVYLNGRLVCSVASSGSGSGSVPSSYFHIGAYDSNGTKGGYASSVIDEVSVWTRGLSLDEVLQVHNSGRGNVVPYTDTPSLYGGIATWKLDEVSGNASDSIGVNTLTNTGTATFTPALINNGADFGTTNLTKKFTASNNLGIDGGEITISMWIKMRTDITVGMLGLFIHGSTTSQVNDLITYDYNAGTPRIQFNRQKQGTSNNIVNTNITLGTSVWHHLVYVYDGATLSTYIDGVAGGTLSTSGNGSGGATSLTEFCDTSAQYASGGLFTSAFYDETTVFNRAISSTEVTSLYNTGLGFAWSWNPSASFLAKKNPRLNIAVTRASSY